MTPPLWRRLLTPRRVLSLSCLLAVTTVSLACSKDEPEADAEQAAARTDEAKADKAPEAAPTDKGDAKDGGEAEKKPTAKKPAPTARKADLKEQLKTTRKLSPKTSLKPKTRLPLANKAPTPKLGAGAVKPIAKLDEGKEKPTVASPTVDKKTPEPFGESPPATNIDVEKAKKVAEIKNAREARKKASAAKTSPAPEAAGKDLSTIFTRNDVRFSTGYQGLLRPGPLPGIDPDESYASLRLRPSGTSGYGAGVQVWEIPNPGYQTRQFNNFLRQYPESKRTRDLGDSAFTSSWGGVRYFVWLDRKSKLLVAVTCDDAVCKDDKALLKLAKRVNGNLPRVYKK